MLKRYTEEVIKLEEDYERILRFLEETGSSFSLEKLNIHVIPGIGYAARAEMKANFAEPGCGIGI
jgi:hypothetical protein